MSGDQPSPLAEAAVPYLPRGVRLQFDRVRETQVLLAPERVMQLDAVGHAILSELDGESTVAAIIDRLAARYEAPRDEIAGDVRDYLKGLIERQMVFLKPDASHDQG